MSIIKSGLLGETESSHEFWSLAPAFSCVKNEICISNPFALLRTLLCAFSWSSATCWWCRMIVCLLLRNFRKFTFDLNLHVNVILFIVQCYFLNFSFIWLRNLTAIRPFLFSNIKLKPLWNRLYSKLSWAQALRFNYFCFTISKLIQIFENASHFSI